jgi:hypothetical protein
MSEKLTEAREPKAHATEVSPAASIESPQKSAEDHVGDYKHVEQITAEKVNSYPSDSERGVPDEEDLPVSLVLSIIELYANSLQVDHQKNLEFSRHGFSLDRLSNPSLPSWRYSTFDLFRYWRS